MEPVQAMSRSASAAPAQAALGIGLTLVVLGAIAACGTREATWHEEATHRWRELQVPRRGRVGFTELPVGRTGIAFANTVPQRWKLERPNSLLGSGVALGDIDGDGLVDIYLSRLDGPNALYRNMGDWRFEEIADASGVAAAGRTSTGAAFADVDGDGDLDLLVTALGGPNALFINDGTGRFTDRTVSKGLSSTLGSTTPAFADIDGDGDLDLYISNYKADNALDMFPPQERTFDRVVYQVDGRWEIAPRFRDHYRVQVLEEYGLVARIQRADPDWLYLNDGTGKFTAVSWTSGRFLDATGRPLAEQPDYFGLTARFFDADGDGDPDLYVTNDFEDPDHFWLNDGSGAFQAIGPLAIRATSNAAMSIDVADIDRDGQMDFFLADMLSRDRAGQLRRMPSHTALPKLIGKIDDRPQMQRNTLFLNRGDTTFAQIAELAGVEASGWTWATLFLDVDLDGYEDLLLANGHVWDVQDSDSNDRVRTKTRLVEWQKRILLFPSLDQKNVAFRNNGDLTFTDAGDEWGFGTEPDVSYGLAAADLDGDGDLDVIVNRLDRPAAVLRNNNPRARVAVRLRGLTPNTRGIGAKIAVYGGPVRVQVKEVTAGGLYLSGSDQLLSFAAGHADSLRITVTWRSGRRSVIQSARPNRLYEIVEPTGSPEPVVPDSVPSPGRLFADVSDRLRHRHHESPYDDFARQPLLPNAMSRFGPGIAWYDADGDGDEDLFITSGRGGRLGYFRNEDGRFVPVPTATAPYDQTGIVAVPDSSGGPAVLVGQASYESALPSEAQGVSSVIKFSLGDSPVGPGQSVTPGAESSTGPLAVADYDLDGDLDLFVGGRVLPGQYPQAASSQLFRNESGQFVPDEAATEILSEIGLVSAATFSDIDGDGDPDLILAAEWGPLRLLINTGGAFSEAGGSWGLAEYGSRWNGVTTGDLDGDGRLDIVATSWGRNTRWRPTPDRPIYLFYGDFDASGTVDLIAAQHDDSLDAFVPLIPFQIVRAAIPSISFRIPDFTTYASATLEQILGHRLDAVERLAVTTMDHMLFLNRGDRFEPQPLPVEAQFAPAFYAGVADFDGDGNEDLFITQNFFPTERETPRYDSGRGLLMLGDGIGNLKPLAANLSGIAVYGDQRGAAFADYDRDGRVDLAVSQNGAATRLYHNERARPGLRVRLVGPTGNPLGVGAAIRLVYRDRRGPVREVHGGSGYWSWNGATQVMGTLENPVAIWVRWPGGSETEVPVPPRATTVTVRAPARGSGGR